MIADGFKAPVTTSDAKDVFLELAQKALTADAAAGFAQAAGMFAIAAAIEAVEMTLRGKY